MKKLTEKKEKLNAKDREMPNAHLYHAILPVVFIIAWMLDTMVFNATIWLDAYVPSWLRFTLFTIVLSLALMFIYLSHKTIFSTPHEAPATLLNKGVLGHVRNPMYLGFQLIYISLICLSISIICIVIFVVIFLVYDKMATFEEKILENLFGDAYLEYKKKVPKWIPRIKSAY